MRSGRPVARVPYAGLEEEAVTAEGGGLQAPCLSRKPRWSCGVVGPQASLSGGRVASCVLRHLGVSLRFRTTMSPRPSGLKGTRKFSWPKRPRGWTPPPSPFEPSPVSARSPSCREAASPSPVLPLPPSLGGPPKVSVCIPPAQAFLPVGAHLLTLHSLVHVTLGGQARLPALPELRPALSHPAWHLGRLGTDLPLASLLAPPLAPHAGADVARDFFFKPLVPLPYPVPPLLGVPEPPTKQRLDLPSVPRAQNRAHGPHPPKYTFLTASFIQRPEPGIAVRSHIH